MDFKEYALTKYGILKKMDTDDNFMLSLVDMIGIRVAQALNGSTPKDNKFDKIDTASNFDIYADERRREKLLNETLQRLYGEEDMQ